LSAQLVWKPFYSVGEASLDAQHQQIIGIVNDLLTAVEGGSQRAVVAAVLDRLLRYTITHFKHEERLMQKHGFPAFGLHKATHDRMRQWTTELRNNADQVVAPDLLRFVKDWWVNHIQGQDKDYVPYLKVLVHS